MPAEPGCDVLPVAPAVNRSADVLNKQLEESSMAEIQAPPTYFREAASVGSYPGLTWRSSHSGIRCSASRRRRF